MSRHPIQSSANRKSGLRMVDITLKETTIRSAVATGKLFMSGETLRRLRVGSLPKGDALAAAQVAGIQAAKRTYELIPMCHPLMLTSVELEFGLDPGSKSSRRADSLGAVTITASVKTAAQTGVEMEALTAVAVAALTIYDMCKGVDREMVVGEIALLSKTGGRSGDYRAAGSYPSGRRATGRRRRDGHA
jgi:cyclic pyranopterin monophosphate synthase